MPRLLRPSLAVALVLALGACGAGTTEDGCPRAAFGDWTRERASAAQFALSFCVPAGYRRVEELVWARPSAGAAFAVTDHLSPLDEAVLSPCQELKIGCSSPPVRVDGLTSSLRTFGRRVGVLETARLRGGGEGYRGGVVALLRVEVGADQWVVARGVHADSTRLPELVRALASVRIERVGRARAPDRGAGAP